MTNLTEVTQPHLGIFGWIFMISIWFSLAAAAAWVFMRFVSRKAEKSIPTVFENKQEKKKKS